MTPRLLVAAAMAGLGTMLLGGCATAHSPTAPKPTHSPRAVASATPQASNLTAIAPDGVNLRTSPTVQSTLIGVVAQGVTLPILGHTGAAGGWWKVQGQSGPGWMTANPEDTSTSSFQNFQSSAAQAWTVLYPASWTFAQQSSGQVSFLGAGETISVSAAATTAALPASPAPGSGSRQVNQVEVYGITTALVAYSGGGTYQALVEFQGDSTEAFLISTTGKLTGAAAAFNLFLDTFSFPIPSASPSP